MYGKDFRKKIIDSYLVAGLSQYEISEKFEVSRNFVINVLRDYKELGIIEKKHKPKPKDSKISGENEKILLDLIKTNPSITLNQISDYFKEHHNLSVGKSSVDRVLKKLKITYKKNKTSGERKIMKLTEKSIRNS